VLIIGQIASHDITRLHGGELLIALTLFFHCSFFALLYNENPLKELSRAILKNIQIVER
jgi:hypothetical protein